MKTIRLLIHSNIYIALAAVALTLATQVQIEINVQWHPYLFLIFFSTLFEYNLHRLITILKNPEALNFSKNKWVKKNLKLFYFLVSFSVIGFAISVLKAKFSVLISLAPLAVITLLYSAPFSKKIKGVFRLRQIPYLKIFLIAIVWATVTVLLPVIHSEKNLNFFHLLTIILERFLFVFAITIPFDIRDMEGDAISGLKTIPLKLGKEVALNFSIIVLFLFFIVATIHYSITNQQYILIAFSISFVSTLIFLINKKIQKLPLYFYGVLDGTMLLQGILVLLAYFVL